MMIWTLWMMLLLMRLLRFSDEVEVIAHDKTIDFDSAKHVLDDEEDRTECIKINP